MPFAHGAWSYQARRALLAQVVPVYQTASRARKHLILDAFVKATGYARPTAIRLLNHPPSDTQTLRRSRMPIYGPEVQQALFLAWKATHGRLRHVLLRALIPEHACQLTSICEGCLLTHRRKAGIVVCSAPTPIGHALPKEERKKIALVVAIPRKSGTVVLLSIAEAATVGKRVAASRFVRKNDFA